MSGDKKFKKFIGASAVILGTTFVALSIIAKKKKPSYVYDDKPEEKNPLEGKKVKFVENGAEEENADGMRGHLEVVEDASFQPTFYDRVVKRGIDVTLSFGGLVLLSPLLAGIALAIYIEDPGPVIFTQKRVGQNKQYFKLHKFRSMKLSTPHDVPTHQLENPDQYITKVGKFIRAHSLDELPQIWDIFVSNLSVIGPRPALWNQDWLVSERDKYGANDVKPGLTGWAQINGRDEIEIPEKAKLDGEYVKRRSLKFDSKCFLGTVKKIAHDDSVVEGGTGEMKKSAGVTESDTCCIYYGKRSESENTEAVKKVLIAGANSYIGDSFKEYMEQFQDDYQVDILETKGLTPTPVIFKPYDVVFCVSGIAHIKETKENKHLYYEVNRDLVIKMAKAAKEAGVRQLILLSSMSVYGLNVGHITKDTQAKPVSNYGKSKLQADLRIKQLEDDDFIFTCLRPPMIYGKGCKGNYQILRKFALKSPIFPEYTNERSMLYIGNLCKFVKDCIDLERGGLFFPQNKEYVRTSDLVRLIGKENSKNIRFTKVFNGILGVMPIELVKKVFGNLTYEKNELVDEFDFAESIRLTEK